MSTSTLEAQRIEPAQRIVLERVSWGQYVAISNALPERSGLRTAFDGEKFELMTTSVPHEHFKRLLNRLIETLTFELHIPLQGGGQSTFRSELQERGLEPDECYWIGHAERIDPQRDWNPETDPPPDLAVEVDVTSSSVDREGIYAVLGVPELWRFDGQELTAWRLAHDGSYQPVAVSLSFPFLRVESLLPFVLAETKDENALARTFIAWIHQQEFAQE